MNPAERKNLYDFLFDLLKTDVANDNLIRFKSAIIADEAIRNGFPPDMMKYLERNPKSEINLIPVLSINELSPALIARKMDIYFKMHFLIIFVPRFPNPGNFEY